MIIALVALFGLLLAGVGDLARRRVNLALLICPILLCVLLAVFIGSSHRAPAWMIWVWAAGVLVPLALWLNGMFGGADVLAFVLLATTVGDDAVGQRAGIAALGVVVVWMGFVPFFLAIVNAVRGTFAFPQAFLAVVGSDSAELDAPYRKWSRLPARLQNLDAPHVWVAPELPLVAVLAFMLLMALAVGVVLG